jgi:hypothetical protein
MVQGLYMILYLLSRIPALRAIFSVLKIHDIDLALGHFHIRIYLNRTFKDIKHTVSVALGFCMSNQTE